MGYTVSIATKVIKKTHIISMYKGNSVSALRSWFSRVPFDCCITNIDIDDNGLVVLTFLEEKEE